MSLNGPLLLLGCGKMGGALLAGWLDRGLPAEEVTVIEPQADAVADFTRRGVLHVPSPDQVEPELLPKIVLLAVKPQMMEAAVPPLARLVGPQTAFLSIAAGKTVASLTALLAPGAAVVRAMPNTPAAVGRGMSVLYANAEVAASQRALCAELMAAAGETAWIDDEALMDPVTALSGGGPAYVFLLIEVLAKAGVAAGLPAELAERLARVTVAGAGELVHRSDLPPATLRENVTSPGGTTLEALKVLMAEDGLQPLVTRAIAAATRRSRELAS